MSYADSAVETALEKVRELLRPDGGDILLAEDAIEGDTSSDTGSGTESGTGSGTGTLKLQLVVENSDCPECILPVDMLEPIALNIMSADLPGLTSVAISDPRVAMAGEQHV